METKGNDRRQWAIGPLNPVTIGQHKNSYNPDKCLMWLGKQPPKSVIYISFGNTTSLPEDQKKEPATGPEQSKTKFMWVLKDADKGDIFTDECRRAELPDGFEVRMEGVGLIIRDWAPQLQILGHPSIGGFMSHCGWNSCMESISMGVPIAAWPMHSDQPRNAVLIIELLKVGLIVREWAQREAVVQSSVIKESVGRLMILEGEEMRKRANELKRICAAICR